MAQRAKVTPETFDAFLAMKKRGGKIINCRRDSRHKLWDRLLHEFCGDVREISCVGKPPYRANATAQSS